MQNYKKKNDVTILVQFSFSQSSTQTANDKSIIKSQESTSKENIRELNSCKTFDTQYENEN